MENKDRVIVALDTDSLDTAQALITNLKGVISYFKVGKELFTAHGNEALHAIEASGARCFLDLKYHDIPTTVAKASTVACNKGIAMFNVHACGGFKMMKSAREAVDKAAIENGLFRPLVLAVTVLTSMSEEELAGEIGVSRTMDEQVVALASLAKDAGLDGVVASAKEVTKIKAALGDDFVVVTPGIRPQWAASNDQARVVTPKDAVAMGVDYMVIGRPITAAENPREAAERIIEEI